MGDTYKIGRIMGTNKLTTDEVYPGNPTGLTRNVDSLCETLPQELRMNSAHDFHMLMFAKMGINYVVLYYVGQSTSLCLYTANHKEYLQVPIRVVRCHLVSAN